MAVVKVTESNEGIKIIIDLNSVMTVMSIHSFEKQHVAHLGTE